MIKLKAMDCRLCAYKENCSDYEDPSMNPGLLSKACSAFKPFVPGPDIADPNIMELCFKNGEEHMKDKVCRELTRIAEHMPCITLAQAIQLLEGL
jgi:hypothetical protein